MSLMESNRAAHQAELNLRSDVQDALSQERVQAKEILKERYWAMLDTMSTDAMAILIVDGSTQGQIQELHREFCAEIDEDREAALAAKFGPRLEDM